MLTGEHTGDVVIDDDVDMSTARTRWWSRVEPHRDLGAILGLTLVIAVPILVALVALRSPRWLPLVDMAQIEMRVRDVGSTHPPLIGLGGRIRAYGEAGSHPGPLAFYLLWPVYRLLGSSAWALQVASATLGLVAVGLSVWIGHRRGGTTGAVAVTALLALLLRSYGAVMLTEPWNPRLPVMWWIVCVLAVWSVVCGDVRLLPLVVLAGTICVQTHIPYVALVGGLWFLTAVVLVSRHSTLGRREVLPSAGLLALFWAPPVIDQVTHHPGNLRIIVSNFLHPYDTRPPLSAARELWLRHLDLTGLVHGHFHAYAGRPGRGALFLLLWAVTAVFAWRRRASTLVALHVVVGLALVLGAFAVSRIFGPLWPYLMHWARGTSALMALAIGWTLASLPRSADETAATADRLPALRFPRPTLAVLGVVTLTVVALFTLEAPDTEMPGQHLSTVLEELSDATRATLRDDPAGCGDDCTYFVTWVDPVDIGAIGYGMVIELERHGIAARVDPYEGPAVRFHRTAPPASTDAEVHVSTGDADIRAWQLRDDAEMLAIVDPRTATEREEFRSKRELLLLELHTQGLHDLAQAVGGTDPIELDPRMSKKAQNMVLLVNNIPRPTAVFLRVPAKPAP